MSALSHTGGRWLRIFSVHCCLRSASSSITTIGSFPLARRDARCSCSSSDEDDTMAALLLLGCGRTSSSSLDEESNSVTCCCLARREGCLLGGSASSCCSSSAAEDDADDTWDEPLVLLSSSDSSPSPSCTTHPSLEYSESHRSGLLYRFMAGMSRPTLSRACSRADFCIAS